MSWSVQAVGKAENVRAALALDLAAVNLAVSEAAAEAAKAGNAEAVKLVALAMDERALKDAAAAFVDQALARQQAGTTVQVHCSGSVHGSTQTLYVSMQPAFGLVG